MKKIFLTSVNVEDIRRAAGRPPGEMTLAFVPTAGDPYEDKWFVEKDREKLKDMGFVVLELDLKEKRQEELQRILQKVDIVYVAGGNTFYLLQKVRESGFDEIIEDLVENGLLYAGASAGAVLAGPTIEPIKLFDDPTAAPDLKDFKGLGLVDFVVLPHYGQEKYEEKYRLTLREWEKQGYDFVLLSDSQSILVEEGQRRIIEEG